MHLPQSQTLITPLSRQPNRCDDISAHANEQTDKRQCQRIANQTLDQRKTSTCAPYLMRALTR